MMPPADDIDRIMAIMTAAFEPQYGEAWNHRQVEDALLLSNCHYLLIAEHGKPPLPGEPAAGFSLSRHGFEEEELLLFAVDPKYRRQGLGAKLLARFVASARARGASRLLLEMRQDNPAQHLYRQFGFSQIGHRTGYYRTTSGQRLDALTFACDCLAPSGNADDKS